MIDLEDLDTVEAVEAAIEINIAEDGSLEEWEALEAQRDRLSEVGRKKAAAPKKKSPQAVHIEDLRTQVSEVEKTASVAESETEVREAEIEKRVLEIKVEAAEAAAKYSDLDDDALAK